MRGEGKPDANASTCSLILFWSLDAITWPVAVLCRFLGRRAVFCQPWGGRSGRLRRFAFRLFGFENVDVEAMCWEDGSAASNLRGVLCRKVLDRFFPDDVPLEWFAATLPGKVTPRQMRIILFEYCNQQLGRVSRLLVLAKALHRDTERVSLCLLPGGVESQALAVVSGEFTNVLPVLLLRCCLCLRFAWVVASKALTLAGSKVRALAFGGAGKPESTRTVQTETESANRSFPVVFFPHQGILYGNLFAKDYYFSKDATSPFLPGNVLHMEYSALPAESRQYYVQRGIPHERLEACPIPVLMKKLPGLLLPGLRMALGRSGLTGAVLAAVAALLVHRYLWAIQRLQGCRLALVGYDFLFPRALSVALQIRAIRVVAVQERFIQAFNPIFSGIFDDYLVFGERVVRCLRDNPYCLVGAFHVVGCPRADFIRQHMSAARSLEAHVAPRVLVLDFHSDPRQPNHLPNEMVNWSNNKAFYEDVLRLARRFPQASFVIRGKNADWQQIDFFRETREAMATVPNITVNTDYDRLNVSYELTAWADVVLAKHTSLVDEALMAGKPVIVHDYARNCARGVSSVFDYDGMDIFVFSYDELEQRLGAILAGEHEDTSETLHQLLDSYYCASQPGESRKRILEILEALLHSSLKQEVV